MKRIFKSNLFFLCLVLLQFIVPSILLFAFKLDTSTVLILSSLFTIFLPTIIYFLVTKKSVKETLMLHKLSKRGLIASIALPFLCYPIASFCNILTSFWYTNNVGDAMQTMVGMPSLVFLFAFAISPAIGEEIIMRGVVLDGYKNKSIHTAAFMNGLLFAILHFNMPQFLYAFFLGAVFSYLVYYTGSIFSSMIVHFIFNGFSSLSFLVLNKLMNSELIPNEVTDMINNEVAAVSFNITQLLYSLFISIICIIVIIEIFKWLNKYKNSTHEIPSTEDTSLENLYTSNYEGIEINDSHIPRNEDDFKRFSSKLANSIAYLPIAISIIIFIFTSI